MLHALRAGAVFDQKQLAAVFADIAEDDLDSIAYFAGESMFRAGKPPHHIMSWMSTAGRLQWGLAVRVPAAAGRVRRGCEAHAGSEQASVQHAAGRRWRSAAGQSAARTVRSGIRAPLLRVQEAGPRPRGLPES